jgi:hypothetical protein
VLRETNGGGFGHGGEPSIGGRRRNPRSRCRRAGVDPPSTGA